MLTGGSDIGFKIRGLRVGKANHSRASDRGRTQVQNEARFRCLCLRSMLEVHMISRLAPSVPNLSRFTKSSMSFLSCLPCDSDSKMSIRWCGATTQYTILANSSHNILVACLCCTMIKACINQISKTLFRKRKRSSSGAEVADDLGSIGQEPMLAMLR